MEGGQEEEEGEEEEEVVLPLDYLDPKLESGMRKEVKLRKNINRYNIS